LDSNDLRWMTPSQVSAVNTAFRLVLIMDSYLIDLLVCIGEFDAAVRMVHCYAGDRVHRCLLWKGNVRFCHVGLHWHLQGI
jgi:hypothetical protein